MLNSEQKRVTADELTRNFEKLQLSQAQVLTDLQFTAEQLENALRVENSNGYDVWKLRDYLAEQLQEQGTAVTAFSVLKENRWYSYLKTW